MIGGIATYAIMSSVIRCELSMRPRSASSESAAEDLYALFHRLAVALYGNTQEDALYIVPDAAKEVSLIKGCLHVGLQIQCVDHVNARSRDDVRMEETAQHTRTFVRLSSRA